MFERRVFLALALALASATLLAPRTPAQGKKPTQVVPARLWSGVNRDEALKKHAPEAGLITDAKAFEKVWKAWGVDGKVPEIDFKKQFVVVGLARGPNRPGPFATLDDKGDLQVGWRQTRIGGPGFGYALAAFDRKGVTSINGKALPKK
jgi:hypothetical protein